MKLYQKLTSLLVAAVMAAVLMPVCMAAPGDSVETRVNNALAPVSYTHLGKVYTAATVGTVLPGVTRRSCIELLKDWGYEVIEGKLAYGLSV